MIPRNQHRPQRSAPPPNKDYQPKEFSGLVKRLASLNYDKGRMKASQFLIEGVKLISDVLKISPNIIREVFTVPGFENPELMAALKKAKISSKVLSVKEVAYLANTQTHQGILALANFSTLKPNWTSARYVTLLDGIQDPGNVGSIFRTSIALGMDVLILGKGTCEAYNGKVVRSSAGSIFKIPFEAGVDLYSKINFLRQKGFTIVATSPHSPFTLDNIKLRKKVALIVSNEGGGIDDKLISQADSTVKIPMSKNMESLNVAVAHGILCHQLGTFRT